MTTLLVPLTVLLLAAAPAAPPSPAVRQQVEGLLGAIHGAVPAGSFRALGPGAEEVLAEIAASETMPSKRIRALEALASLGGARAAETHRAVAASRAPSAVRRGAIRGLGRLVDGAAAKQALVPFLDSDRDPAVRAAAAEALAGAAPQASCPEIRARAQAEGDRGRFERALSRCDAEPVDGGASR